MVRESSTPSDPADHSERIEPLSSIEDSDLLALRRRHHELEDWRRPLHFLMLIGPAFQASLDQLSARDRDIVIDYYGFAEASLGIDAPQSIPSFPTEAAQRKALYRARKRFNKLLEDKLMNLQADAELNRDVLNAALKIVRGGDIRAVLDLAVLDAKGSLEEAQELRLRDGTLSLETQIDALYEEIADLTSQSDAEHADPALEERIASSWAELRRLQEEEAERFRSAFEASLAMPVDAGAKILDEIRALRRELEDSASPDAST